jgi:hypothetical protein
VASRPVIDVPLVGATVTQYDEHAVRCGCGKVHEAAAVPGVGRPGTVAWGLNAQALAVFLLVMHHVPVERCAGILEALTGERSSDGFAHSLLERAARAVRGACLLIRAPTECVLTPGRTSAWCSARPGTWPVVAARPVAAGGFMYRAGR